MQTKNQKLKEFLEFTLGQKEVSLIIVKDKKELQETKKELRNKNFVQEKSIVGLIKHISKGEKIFIEYSKDTKKELYDFIIQYPSGQIYFFDTKNSKPVFTTPNYKESAVLLLITQDNLLEFGSSGFNILQNVGLTFKNI